MTGRICRAALLIGLLGGCSEGSRLLIEIALPQGFDLPGYGGDLQVSIVDDQQREVLPARTLGNEALGRGNQRLFDGISLQAGRRYQVRLESRLQGGLCPPGGRVVGVSPLFEYDASMSSIAVYVACADASSTAGTLQASRLLHTATFVADPAPHGRVVIAGGVALTQFQDLANLARAQIHDSIELYDPVTNTSSPFAKSMVAPRVGHAAVAVGDAVLISGGLNAMEIAAQKTLVAISEVERLRGGDLTELAPLNAARGLHLALTLSPDRVLIAGGLAQNDLKQLAKAEIYDPSVPSGQVPYRDLTMKSIHFRPGAVGVAFGERALLVGGLWLNSANVPSSLFCLSGDCGCSAQGLPCFAQGPGLPPMKNRNEHLAGAHVPCSDGPGALYLVGGRTDPDGQVENDDIWFDDIQCLDLTNVVAGFREVGKLEAGPRSEHTVSVVRGPEGTTRLFVAGGNGVGGGPRSDAELIPVSCRCEVLASGRKKVQLKDFRTGHTATTLADGSVLLTGGLINASIAERFNPDF